MEGPKFNIPERIYVNNKEKEILLNLAKREQESGALAFGVFGSRTISSRGKDIDVIIVKDGICKGAVKKREGIFHLTHLPPNFLEDPIANFGKQVYSSAVFIFNYLS